MSVEYLGVFPLAAKLVDAERVRSFFVRNRIQFKGSCWTCELTAERALRCSEADQRDEPTYFEDCWIKGANLTGEFGGEDFYFELMTFDHGGTRHAALRVTNHNLRALMFHLDERGSDLFEFLVGLEMALGSSGGVIGREVQMRHLLDFLEGRLQPDSVKEFVKIVSRPDQKTMRALRALQFEERALGPFRFFYRDLVEWDLVHGS